LLDGSGQCAIKCWKERTHSAPGIVKFGVDLPISGGYSEPRLLMRLAAEAEDAGWDGCFLWDHIGVGGAARAADPWIALAAIATATTRIEIGPMVTPIFRRSPWKLARETVTLDRLSGGRLIFGAGLGSDMFGEISMIGGPLDDRIRAEMLDEGLEILTGLWRGEPYSFAGKHYRIANARFTPAPERSPRIPIWIAGTWPKKPPFRRAARYDGVLPVTGDLKTPISPGQFREIIRYIREIRSANEPFDFAHIGGTPGKSLDQDRETVAPYAAAGATWWLESIAPARQSLDDVRARIRRGPPTLAE
jgi:alkanesulfonate monooxygenase SsuD/methylene tetrahydromethanopterin reductase-like flavin-dependent oxidoreductase (luciferase family)